MLVCWYYYFLQIPTIIPLKGRRKLKQKNESVFLLKIMTIV